jgi:peptide/nickel transport system substrate-binding protein
MTISLRWLAVVAVLLGPGIAHAQTPPDTLVVAFGAEPTTMDPARYAAGVDLYGVTQSFEQLLRPDASGKLTNWLAESWKIEGTADKPIIDVHIRPGVKFHNGDPLTAADFEYSYQRLRDPKISRWSFYQESVEQFEVVDDLHFRIHFKEPDSNYIANYLQLWAMPKKYIEQVGDQGFVEHPIGTGPWVFRSWKPKQEMMFDAFDDYWNKDVRPGAKHLSIKFIPEDLTRVAAYKTGAVDFIDAVPLSALDEFRKLPNTTLGTFRTGNNLNLAFDTQIPESPFNDVKVRLATAYAIDFDAIIKTVLFGQGQRYAEVAEGGAGYDSSLKPYPYDPKKARQLLAEAGYAKGFDTKCYNLITPREPNIKEFGEAMYAYLSAVGIRCKIVGLEYVAWLAQGGRASPAPMEGLFPWMFGHGLPGDPGRAWASQLHSYIPGTGWGGASFISDPEIDALIEQSKRTMDPEQRNSILQHIARLKHERVHSITTYLPLATFAWRTDKVSYTPWPTPGYWHQFQQIGLKTK